MFYRLRFIEISKMGSLFLTNKLNYYLLMLAKWAPWGSSDSPVVMASFLVSHVCGSNLISPLPLSIYPPPKKEEKKPCSSQDYFLSLLGCYGMSLLRQRYFKCKIVRMLNGIKCPKFRDGKNFPHHSAFSHMGFSFPECVIVCVCVYKRIFFYT